MYQYTFDETKTFDDLEFLKYECLNFVNKSETNIRELPSRHVVKKQLHQLKKVNY